MENELLLEIKRKIDENLIYYHSLNKRNKKRRMRLINNNRLKDELTSEEEIELENKSSKDENKFQLKLFTWRMLIYLYIYFILNILKDFSIISQPIFTIGYVADLSFFCYHSFNRDFLYKKWCEKKEKSLKNELDELEDEYNKVKRQMHVIKERVCELTDEYYHELEKLNEREYKKYLEQLSEYYKFLLDSSDDVLASSYINYKVSDEECETYPILEDEFEHSQEENESNKRLEIVKW